MRLINFCLEVVMIFFIGYVSSVRPVIRMRHKKTASLQKNRSNDAKVCDMAHFFKMPQRLMPKNKEKTFEQPQETVFYLDIT